jgi:hypothetical protein
LLLLFGPLANLGANQLAGKALRAARQLAAVAIGGTVAFVLIGTARSAARR